ncbi:MAG TPA: hypothetical protein VFB62_22045, partial [Polyangiaceae bacterium]|nr:hypothetical protein [Polyangiaceae bacterium]
GRVVAWRELGAPDVVEAATGYRLNVRNAPGVGTRSGANGESFYVYGFAWYPRWQRILPEPIIAVIEDYYLRGIEHVRSNIGRYRQVASQFGGELASVAWDDSLIARMQSWGARFPGAPLVYLPDSGTIDIRSERFGRALAESRVMVDEATVDAYLASDIVRSSRYNQSPTKAQVLHVLTQPYRRPEVFSDLEKAIILAATYQGDEPLHIVIDMDRDGGFFVPDTGQKVIYIAGTDVDLNLGYEGLLLSKFAHETSHILEFKNRRFLAERCWPEEDDMIETLKYLMELMWWVQRYPNDAPAWDWEPINSGLVLTSLLAADFPNSRC